MAQGAMPPVGLGEKDSAGHAGKVGHPEDDLDAIEEFDDFEDLEDLANMGSALQANITGSANLNIYKK